MPSASSPRVTRVLSVRDINPPQVPCEDDLRDWFERERTLGSLPVDQVNHLLEAAHLLQTSSIPVAFPTETVYGLGADATRSEAVRGIFEAKRRPADNPLIVHVGSLKQLRHLLRPIPSQSHDANTKETLTSTNGHRDVSERTTDPIPDIYKPLIFRFWPGPLTLLFPLSPPPSPPSPFASETHPNLQSVGIRMPSSPLARLLISLCDRPLAAPSANASTRPSPTSAAHVLEDMNGRIDVILDGGSCSVGVESTVVDAFGADGKSPAVLRPGRVGIEEIRSVGGSWTGVQAGYGHRSLKSDGEKHVSSKGSKQCNGQSSLESQDINTALEVEEDAEANQTTAPRAPGMKYRHYAPRARVILFEEQNYSSSSSEQAAREKVIEYFTNHTEQSTTSPPHTAMPIGIITTNRWRPDLRLGRYLSKRASTKPPDFLTESVASAIASSPSLTSYTYTFLPSTSTSTSNTEDTTAAATSTSTPKSVSMNTQPQSQLQPPSITLHSISLGPTPTTIARGLFAALRELDGYDCSVILIEGIDSPDTSTADVNHNVSSIGSTSTSTTAAIQNVRGEKDGDGVGVEVEVDDDDKNAGRHLIAAVMDRVRKAAAG